MSLSENFIKNQRYLDNWCEQSLSVRVFQKEIETIYQTKNPSGRITPKKQKELLDLVVQDNFFVCWCKSKTLPQSLWNQTDNDEIKTDTEEFDIPFEEIKVKLLEKMKELNINIEKNSINELIPFLISFKSEEFWINEYYGESVMLQYIYMSNDALKGMTK